MNLEPEDLRGLGEQPEPEDLRGFPEPQARRGRREFYRSNRKDTDRYGSRNNYGRTGNSGRSL